MAHRCDAFWVVSDFAEGWKTEGTPRENREQGGMEASREALDPLWRYLIRYQVLARIPYSKAELSNLTQNNATKLLTKPPFRNVSLF